ncbi:hypothetical protein B0H14DRAFT_2628042 [Mycena olivaceomarginata]|nr:hypothetical protein B0H14DRAFT_2628042 [Mycena olivaceomarginata]
MSPEVLHHFRKLTEYCSCPLEAQILHKIYTIVEAQQKGNKVKNFRQGENGRLLKDGQARLQQYFEFFQIEGLRAVPDVIDIERNAQKRHQEVLDMIEKLSEGTASESAYVISGHNSRFSNRAQDFPWPGVRNVRHTSAFQLFNTAMPRIAILGAGGMGKTSLAKAVLHHTEIMVTYAQNRFFVTCTSATTELELVNLIGAHLGLKPGKDLTQAVLQHFSNNLPSLLILDELETLWESATSCKDIEELLLLLTDIREFVQKLHEPHAAFVAINAVGIDSGIMQEKKCGEWPF